MVEHNLAKVRVAGPSPVSRSENPIEVGLFFSGELRSNLEKEFAQVVESVDTQDLKSCNHCGCAGSSPAPGTEKPDI